MKTLLGSILGILVFGLLILTSRTNSIETNYNSSLELSKELKAEVKDWNSDKVKDFKKFCLDLKRISRGDLIVLKHNYFYNLKPQVVIYKVVKKSPNGIILKENNRFKPKVYMLKIWPASRLIRVYNSTVSIIIRKNKARLYIAELFKFKLFLLFSIFLI